MTASPELTPSYSGRSRDFMRQEVKDRIASVDSHMVVLQHAGHQALYARTSADVRHWLGLAHRAATLVAGAAEAAEAAIDRLCDLYPPAHGDAERQVPGRPPRCACGRVAETCRARLSLEVGSRQWVDERGRVRDVADAGSDAIPPSQR